MRIRLGNTQLSQSTGHDTTLTTSGHSGLEQLLQLIVPAEWGVKLPGGRGFYTGGRGVLHWGEGVFTLGEGILHWGEGVLHWGRGFYTGLHYT